MLKDWKIDISENLKISFAIPGAVASITERKSPGPGCRGRVKEIFRKWTRNFLTYSATAGFI
jgi:hypothetical protein